MAFSAASRTQARCPGATRLLRYVRERPVLGTTAGETEPMEGPIKVARSTRVPGACPGPG